MSLIELSVVLLILAALAGMVVPGTSNTRNTAVCQATDATLAVVRDAIMGTGAAPGYLSDVGDLPKHPTSAAGTGYSLHYLFADWDVSDSNCLPPNTPANTACSHLKHFNPVTRRGWHGPYLLNGATINAATGELGPLDHYLNYSPSVRSIELQAGDTGFARLVSKGADGTLNTSATATSAELAARNSGGNANDDRVLFLKTTDPGSNQPCGN